MLRRQIVQQLRSEGHCDEPGIAFLIVSFFLILGGTLIFSWGRGGAHAYRAPPSPSPPLIHLAPASPQSLPHEPWLSLDELRSLELPPSRQLSSATQDEKGPEQRLVLDKVAEVTQSSGVAVNKEKVLCVFKHHSLRADELSRPWREVAHEGAGRKVLLQREVFEGQETQRWQTSPDAAEQTQYVQSAREYTLPSGHVVDVNNSGFYLWTPGHGKLMGKAGAPASFDPVELFGPSFTMSAGPGPLGALSFCWEERQLLVDGRSQIHCGQLIQDQHELAWEERALPLALRTPCTAALGGGAILLVECIRPLRKHASGGQESATTSTSTSLRHGAIFDPTSGRHRFLQHIATYVAPVVGHPVPLCTAPPPR